MPLQALHQIERRLEPLPVRNGLLRELSAATAAVLATAGRQVAFGPGGVLFSEGEAAANVLFVDRGLVTLQWMDLDGGTAEVDAIGEEGALGLAEVLARGKIAFEARAELATEGLLVPAEAVRQLVAVDRDVAALCWTYALEQQTRLRRGIGCASRHGARQRLADYLVAIEATTPGAPLFITQESLAAALGVYRTTVTALIARFVEEGLLTIGRGWLRVADRSGLAHAACGCRGRRG